MQNFIVLSAVLYLFTFAEAIFLFGSSTGPMQCRVKDGQIYLADLPLRPLDPSEQADADAFSARIEACKKKFEGFMDSCTKPPAFCGGSDITLFTFPGCHVLTVKGTSKIYKNQKFVKNFNSEDQTQMDQFNNNVKEYQVKQQAFLAKQAKQAPANGGFGPALMGGFGAPGSPLPPSPPAFCGL